MTIPDQYTKLRAALDALNAETGGRKGIPWFDRQQTLYEELTGELGRELPPIPETDMVYIAAANPQAIHALLAERDQYARILEGLHKDAIDGGWTAAGISAYAKKMEAEIAALRNPWISVQVQLPAPGVPALVFTPPQPDDYPDDVRIEFDFIDSDSDEPCWHNHNEHYEHYCCVAKGGSDVSWSGPSEDAPYTHWMAIPVLPRTALTQDKS